MIASNDPLPSCPLATALALRICDAREELTRRWLDRISARVNLDPNEVFPSDELLDHVPMLFAGIAAYIEDPAQEIPADAPVIAKAMELGALRHEQGFDEYEILKEFELLGGVLFAFLVREVRELQAPCDRDEILVCGHRLFRAIAVIQEASVAHYLQRMRARLSEREARLRAFNRALTHELKNEIGAILGAAELLDEPGLAEDRRPPAIEIIRRNARVMRDVLGNLVELSRLDPEARHQRRILLPQAVAEAVRQLRDRARASGVAVRIGPLPAVEVPAAAVELSLTNYLSNAIKYADPAKAARWVLIRAFVSAPRREIVVEVCDNGLGVPEEKRPHLFAQGFRAHEETVTDVEGTGLGLTIVRDAIEAVGGRAWVTFPPHGGSCFAFALPARRAADVADGAPARGSAPDA
ncbi:ATP-binding region ATPase domain protein (plasmid) [Gemmatirosa kalamazoonensis]|uniref:histidine kinase n=1 Tax=Gemmatirosa kalamazoonensis TaxID=861299 RepID=W0RPL3_9BACT|nr:sensor histidine kinase [Gemmatirosa kalamazoonensis]AHG92661.1 ATP-binding region ATPase domain protein [Gemmatirosa kalamazoonensis]